MGFEERFRSAQHDIFRTDFLYSHHVAIDVKHNANLFLVGRVVQGRLADGAHQREVDFVALVFLVVTHQVDEVVVVAAIEVERTIVIAHKGRDAVKGLDGKPTCC